MAAQTDSPERISADILIAMIQSSTSSTQKNGLCDSGKVPDHFKAIYNAVKDAKDGEPIKTD